MKKIQLVKQLRAIWWSAVGALVVFPVAAMGQQVAFDDGNPTGTDYQDGWDEDDNGGFGFEPWTGGMYANPWEIDSGTPEPDNDLGAPAFRYGTGGFGYWAIRPFTAPMTAGQTFKLDFDQFPYSFPDPFPDFAYLSNDSLMRWSSTGGERISLYNWYAGYNDGETTTFFNSADEWGIGALTAFDNLNGGAALPTGGAGFMTGYTGSDSTDGFSVTLDIVTTDTYRLRIEDDNVLKVDVSGQLRGGATTGQGIDQLTFWSSDGSPADINTSYFTNLEILETPSEGIDGDYNNDGSVNAADYVTFRKYAGTMNVLPNDPHGGTIDIDQYNTWRANFGEMDGSGSGLGAVPEPSSLVLLVLGGVALVRLRRSR